MAETAPKHGATLARGAAGNDWIEFWYQPQVDLMSGEMVGAEALTRLRHPELGMLRPGSLFAEASAKPWRSC